jgi:hypothetical protein
MYCAAMLLRIVRVALIVVGLVVLGYGLVEGFQHDDDDNGVGGQWNCHPIGEGPDTRCDAAMQNSGDTHVTALCLTGLGLICTSMAVSLLERRPERGTPALPTTMNETRNGPFGADPSAGWRGGPAAPHAGQPQRMPEFRGQQGAPPTMPEPGYHQSGPQGG